MARLNVFQRMELARRILGHEGLVHLAKVKECATARAYALELLEAEEFYNKKARENDWSFGFSSPWWEDSSIRKRLEHVTCTGRTQCVVTNVSFVIERLPYTEGGYYTKGPIKGPDSLDKSSERDLALIWIEAPERLTAREALVAAAYIAGHGAGEWSDIESVDALVPYLLRHDPRLADDELAQRWAWLVRWTKKPRKVRESLGLFAQDDPEPIWPMGNTAVHASDDAWYEVQDQLLWEVRA